MSKSSEATGNQSNQLTDSHDPSTRSARSDGSDRPHQLDECGKYILDSEYEIGVRPFSRQLPDLDYSIQRKKISEVRRWVDVVEKQRPNLDRSNEM